jgi:hypothetical protein
MSNFAGCYTITNSLLQLFDIQDPAIAHTGATQQTSYT